MSGNDQSSSPMDTECNEASWVRLVQYIEDSPNHRLKQLILPLVHRAIEAQFDSLFEARWYFDHILIFPPDKYASQDGPRVTIELRSHADPHLYISLCNWDVQCQSPAQCHQVRPEGAFAVFTRYLQHLWEEAVAEPIPEVLRRAENYKAVHSSTSDNP